MDFTQELQQKEPSFLLEQNLPGLCNNKVLDLSLPLLLLASRLAKLTQLDSERIGSIKEMLVGEILTISSSLSMLHLYDEKDIIKLRYCLCVFIDEMLLHNEIFINSHWANHTLTIRLFNETLGGDKFFDIAGQWLLDPKKHKDMLEFIYACLICGYAGKYALDDQDKILYFCNDIAQAIAPVLDSNEQIALNLPYKHIHRPNRLEEFKRKYLKPFFIVAIVGVVAVSFLFSYLKLESNNSLLQSKLSQDIKAFMQE